MRGFLNGKFLRSATKMKLKNPAIILMLAASIVLYASCHTAGVPVSDEATVKQWINFATNGTNGIPHALDLMSFPFNWDGELLTRDEAVIKLQDFRAQITNPGVPVTWSEWQTVKGEDIPKHLQSSKHWSKYQKSRDSISAVVTVLSQFTSTQPPLESTNGHYFGLNESGRITAWFN